MNSPITGALVVCVAAAGVAAGALFLQADDDSPTSTPTTNQADPAANGNNGNSNGDPYGADGPTDDGATGNPAGASLEISGFQFGSVEVAAGGTVTVANRDSAPHTVTADDGDFDAGQVDGGSTGAFSAPSQPGTYDFHCEIHPDMSGSLTVR